MDTTSQTLPDQQQPLINSNPIPQAVPITSSSSGSIGPFFAVISVLTVLAFLSCVLGRILTRDQTQVLTPLESINDRMSCLGWLKHKCRMLQHHHPDVEFGSKAMIKGLGEEKNADAYKVKHGDEVPPQA